jgi:hypothetical protein
VDTRITKYRFETGGMSYFRGNAHLVELGTYGEKKDPIGAKAYVDPQSKVKAETLATRVKIGKPVKIDWNEVSKADLEAEGVLKFFSLGKKGTASFTHEQARTAKLELLNFSISEGPLQQMLNTDADGARRFLADEGDDGRIVSEAWVVVSAELGQHFATYAAASAGVKAFGSSLDVSASGGQHGTQTITLSAGTTFAYKLHKVKDWNKGKTQIDNMEADYKGMS